MPEESQSPVPRRTDYNSITELFNALDDEGRMTLLKEDLEEWIPDPKELARSLRRLSGVLDGCVAALEELDNLVIYMVVCDARNRVREAYRRSLGLS